MHIDLLNAIAENRGYVLEYLPMDSTVQCVDMLEQGQVDLVLGVSGDRYTSWGDLTDPVSTSSLCMIVESNRIAQGQSKAAYCAVFEYGMVPYTMMRNLGVNKYCAVGSQAQILEAYRRQGADAMVGIKDSLLYQMEQAGNSKEFTILHNHLGTVSYGVMVRPEDRELLHSLNNAIAQLKASQQYDTIYDRWVVKEDTRQMQSLIRNIMRVGGIAALAVFAYVLLSTRMRSVLKRQVEAQTQKIQAANRELEVQFNQICNENELRNRIIRHSPSGMLLCDGDYRVTLINRSACQMVGLGDPAKEVNALELPIFREILQEVGTGIFELGNHLENKRITLPQAGGELASFRYSANQIVLGDTVTGVLLTVQDITREEQEKRESFEAEKNRILNRIIAGIAHEIRNPLMSIRTFATLIESQGDNRQVQESFAQYVPGEVDRINKLIENLIHYAKPFKRQVVEADVAEIIEECAHLVKPSLRINKFRLELELEQGLTIDADRTQMMQVLMNLMMNGIEAMEKRRNIQKSSDPLTLRVTAQERDGHVVVRVWDQGVGMNLEERERCIEPFFTTKGEGIGLGLALCAQYVHDNQGSITLQSREMEFTEFILTFRRSAA